MLLNGIQLFVFNLQIKSILYFQWPVLYIIALIKASTCSDISIIKVKCLGIGLCIISQQLPHFLRSGKNIRPTLDSQMKHIIDMIDGIQLEENGSHCILIIACNRYYFGFENISQISFSIVYYANQKRACVTMLLDTNAGLS